jgi:small-conductance mechanosensitive channel
METLRAQVLSLFTGERALIGLRAGLLLLVGYTLARLVSTAAPKLFRRRLTAHHAMLLHRGLFYLILGLFLVSALRELGFNLGVLLGAAGVLTVAIGFASQTSASNLISGLFLLAEEPFAVGDVVKVGNTTGEVLSIDLLSLKLRTFDNLYVRIPNETLIKSEVTNLTRFPIRRLDLQLGVAYKEDIAKVRETLSGVADANPLCLEEPPPLFIFQGFGDSALNMQFSVWAKRENFLELRNTIHQEIKAAFDGSGIEIPFPHRTLYAGSVTEPFPVRVVNHETHPPETSADRQARPAAKAESRQDG